MFETHETPDGSGAVAVGAGAAGTVAAGAGDIGDYVPAGVGSPDSDRFGRV